MTKTKKTFEDPTPEQIQEWKRQNGIVFKLDAYDGKAAYIRDPYSSVAIMKKAMTALMRSYAEYVASIINDCWLAGDEEMKTQDKYLEGLNSEMDDITRAPDADYERSGEYYIIRCEGSEVKVRVPRRADVISAEHTNANRESFETNIALINLVAVDKQAVLTLRKEHTRRYIGMLMVLSKLREKVNTQVGKL